MLPVYRQNQILRSQTVSRRHAASGYGCYLNNKARGFDFHDMIRRDEFIFHELKKKHGGKCSLVLHTEKRKITVYCMYNLNR